MEEVRDVGDELADCSETERKGEHAAEGAMFPFTSFRGQSHGNRGCHWRHSAGHVFEQQPVVAGVDQLEDGRGRGDRHSNRQRGEARPFEVAGGQLGSADANATADVRATPACGQPFRGGEIHPAVPARTRSDIAACGCVIGFIDVDPLVGRPPPQAFGAGERIPRKEPRRIGCLAM